MQRWFLAFALVAGSTSAATTVRLPVWVCNGPETLFRSGFQDGERVPREPSGGSGGVFPGEQTRQVSVVGLGGGTHAYYIYLPFNYDPRRAWPMLVVLHGTAPNAADYARSALLTWSSPGVLYTKGVVIVAPIASNGSTWVAPGGSLPSDYDMLDAVVADVEANYNIERSRRYLWGFSAGGHVAHDLMLNGQSAGLNEQTVAAYSVSAGRLRSLACSSDSDCATRIAAMPRKLPLDIHLGNSDPLYGDPYFASLDAGRFQDNGWVTGQTLWYVTFNGGHTYTTTHEIAIWNTLCPFARDP